MDVGPENGPVTAGARVFRVAVSPAPADFARRLPRFGVQPEAAGFAFDGRRYRGPEDGVAVRDPAAPSETLVLGNGRDAAQRLVLRRLFRDRDEWDYQVVSGELAKTGRFSPGGERLEIDRKSDRDEIGARDAFLRSLTTVERGGARWRFARAEQPAVERLERLLRPAGGSPGAARALPLLVTVFPDAATKARTTGSSRPADLSREGGELRLDVDASAPGASGEVPAAFASAGYAAAEPRLLARPILLAALGARHAGTWWGRPVRGFAAFTAKARVAVSPEETVGSWDEVSPGPRRGIGGFVDRRRDPGGGRGSRAAPPRRPGGPASRGSVQMGRGLPPRAGSGARFEASPAGRFPARCFLRDVELDRRGLRVAAVARDARKARAARSEFRRRHAVRVVARRGEPGDLLRAPAAPGGDGRMHRSRRSRTRRPPE